VVSHLPVRTEKTATEMIVIPQYPQNPE